MIEGEFEESLIVVLWVVAILVSLVMGMRNDGQKQQLLHQGVGGGGKTNGFIPSSFRALSSYLRIVSSGASTVARSAASVASSIVDRDDDADHDQVIWAGFDKLEGEGEVVQQVLLLGYRSGFQVWHVDESNNVRDLVSRHDGPVSFMQMIPNPIASNTSEDKFANSRPLLVVCADGFFAGGSNVQDGLIAPCNGSTSNSHDQMNGNYLPTTVQFYSMKSQSYVHVLKFRSVVYSVRCSSRIIAVSQSTQIHCFGATTLEREYTLLTNPIVMSCPGSGGIGYGPLAVGPRWLAYSGSPVAVSTSGHVIPQHLTPSASFPGFSSNGSFIAHYAKESSKHLASGIVTLGDMGYKKLSRYYSDSNGSLQSVNSGAKGNGTINGHSTDADNIGMVIVKDIVTKNVVAQFRAHKSPISALCFDPSGTILVTASVQGHNINVFKIMPGRENLSASDAGPSYVHLYRLQRGFTNAVIQDISFSDDSKWIMISSSRGTSHLFAINPQGGYVNIQSNDDSFTAKNSGLGVTANQPVRWSHSSAIQMPKQQSLFAAGPPITLSVVSRIRNGTNGWRGTVSGAAAAATGRKGSLYGAIASSFRNCKGNGALYVEGNYSKPKYHLLVFSPTGSMIQYALRTLTGQDSAVVSGLTPAYESAPQADTRLVVEAIHKWNICQSHSRREREDNVDIYGENGISDSNKIYPEEVQEENIVSPKIKNGVMKGNPSLEEEHHLYISEAELQMHQAQVPLWAKPEIYFHPMLKESTIMDEEAASGGEFEIERIPTRMIEARPKHLVPIFDYTQAPKLQQRTPTVDSKINEQLLHHSNGRVSPRIVLGSPECVTNSGDAVTDFKSGIEGTEWDNHLVPSEMMGFVNNNDTLKPNTQLEIVNNTREHSNLEEAQLMFVNSDTRPDNEESF
ncbi:LOW QUALITY PROTEIN: autophagy-related protein 18f [Gastrolobium bilobum]|uniref:LOW QUALITY PROTEIN: autophagy-related protein 18f n=1 Tax=Gastrolobium bilobum TaxID=150636 RepID=UPI002AAFEE80|nr:LOW QUALITY PROTEIN: autophagy-related protein 18f [Gastrolobium bilobum]